MSDGDSRNVAVDGESLTVEDVVAVARAGARVRIPADVRETVRESRERVEDVLETGETVYGVNTGFGELVTKRISRENLTQLQENLVRSHAAGVGDELPAEVVRAMMLVRLNTLCKGYSGVRETVVDHLAAMLNEGIHPVVRSRGSLGASGDLAPLAHMALVLIGEGEATVANGDAHGDGDDDNIERLDGADALGHADLDPLTLAPKEGLALINGTQLTVGVGALVVNDARETIRAADIAGALTTEVTMGSTASSDAAIAEVRPHAGHAESARNVKRLTAGSAIVESHRNCDRVQDAYAIRCLPQVHGAVRDAVSHLREAVEVELNSVTDNPIIYPREMVDDYATGTDDVAVLSGGNFHGAPVAHRLDYVIGALASLASISERRIDRMVNPNLQEPHLPPFLTTEQGLQSGYMLAQYAAAALVNETRSRGRHATDNVPVSGNQEDHVSMSSAAALAAADTVADVRTVVAAELVCAAQAAEFVTEAPELSEQADGNGSGHGHDHQDDHGRDSGHDDSHDDGANPVEPRHGAGTGAAYDAVREVVPPLTADRPIHRDVDAVASLLASGHLQQHVDDALEEPLA